jgi:hypothetical protein
VAPSGPFWFVGCGMATAVDGHRADFRPASAPPKLSVPDCCRPFLTILGKPNRAFLGQFYETADDLAVHRSQFRGQWDLGDRRRAKPNAGSAWSRPVRHSNSAPNDWRSCSVGIVAAIPFGGHTIAANPSPFWDDTCKAPIRI